MAATSSKAKVVTIMGKPKAADRQVISPSYSLCTGATTPHPSRPPMRPLPRVLPDGADKAERLLRQLPLPLGEGWGEGAAG